MRPWSVTKGRGHPTWDNFLVHDINIPNAMSLLPYTHNIKPPICKLPINLDDASIVEARTSPLIWQLCMCMAGPSQSFPRWLRLETSAGPVAIDFESTMLRPTTQRLQKYILKKSDHGSVTMKYDIGKMPSDMRQLHGPWVISHFLTHEHLESVFEVS